MQHVPGEPRGETGPGGISEEGTLWWCDSRSAQNPSPPLFVNQHRESQCGDHVPQAPLLACSALTESSWGTVT